ncbi:DNA-directed DNA polymerase gamma MIP1 KNAG_0E00810 [Huiozyma naganishii CBS 8797]|uniref:DNA polymerase gamma n=1 Tax=Huiozyma naganishii (strain ATCC MYA-139 / BCRC 22969 / CBS 8797 / KCTC 17520 / NBRC 10181 / NCYC 3082 / Yp74L-3) TaxID=1071383 RepID=J7S6F1_HUIN7|nr:hypothetical protein KNAG_0E00810 [Kazachstania naganishii CBS 8797]CCK70349.1 hypothetical protein KNAG_0E00810 [Kazachstania naganishii CBS 8797]
MLSKLSLQKCRFVHKQPFALGFLYPNRIRRHYSIVNDKATNDYSKYKEEPRINSVGIQYLSNSLHAQLFGLQKDKKTLTLTPEKRDQLLKLAKYSLKSHDLLGKKTAITEPISFDVPKLQGNSLDEHFQKLGHFASEPYKSMAMHKFDALPKKPNKWIRKAGWTKYEPGKKPKSVPVPEENTIVFDVETLYKISHYPTLATAVSDRAWYSWCSPYICDPASEKFEHLIPLNPANENKLVIGHNVAYDRARVLEEYNFTPSNSFFLDTQSLHVASCGLASRQRPLYMLNKKRKKRMEEDPLATEEERQADQDIDALDDPWLMVSSMNSLRDVTEFHCGIKMDKEPRDFFAAEHKNVVIGNFQKLMGYCATDVECTSKVFDKVFPLFLQKCPHPVSFGALKSLSSCILPTSCEKWHDYVQRSESLYQSSKEQIEGKIIQIIEDLVKLKDEDADVLAEKVKNDPWLKQLDWTIAPVRMTKKGVPYKNQKKPGYPEWYRSLFPSGQSQKPQVTIKTRKIPIFFKLSWEGYPVVWTKFHGWCFTVPIHLKENFESKNYLCVDKESQLEYEDEYNVTGEVLFRIPHPDGPTMNCTTLLSKPYIHYFEKGILTSGSPYALEALRINSSGSYWMSARERITSQFVVSKKAFPDQFKLLKSGNRSSGKDDLGIILPQIIPMGTVTRRAVENTWLTASNAKANRIGSELKAQVKAPDGYCFVGADVDSEELWIASLVGDSVFNLHGGTAMGWMCLEGTKHEGTDLHTKTAKILGCSRNEAKIFNYGRIYGAGVKFAGQLLKKFSPTLTETGAKNTAVSLYENTKGKSKRSKVFQKFWYGGSESIVFNKLENIAEQDQPRTPVLGCSITSSLMKQNLKANSFLPSRINWVIQSSGVDYLHLLCCSMNYLIAKYGLRARFCISIHDEIRYLAAEEDKYRVALALQISNLWTRAIFCEQIGIDDLPQNCAFFSAVDIDTVMRKEVNMDCVTPSSPTPIPHGETKNIVELLSTEGFQLGAPVDDVDVFKLPYSPREPVLEFYNKSYSKSFLDYFLRMQVQTDSKEIGRLEREYIRELTSEKLARDRNDAEYNIAEYIQEVKMGKHRKINIMTNYILPDTDELADQHLLISRREAEYTTRQNSHPSTLPITSTRNLSAVPVQKKRSPPKKSLALKDYDELHRIAIANLPPTNKPEFNVTKPKREANSKPKKSSAKQKLYDQFYAANRKIESGDPIYR